MKVCMILKRNFEMLKTDSRVLREASALIEAGYEVYLIIFSSNGEEIITEYKGIKIKQVKIKSFWGLDKYNLFSINNKGYQDFIGKLMFFLPYNFLYYRRALQVASDINVDIYHCHDFETLSIGYKLKKRLGCKLIYDSHELWTESSYFSILPKIISLPLKMITVFLEKKIIRRTDINITVNDSISHYLYKKYNIIKPKVIRNVPKFIPIKNNENLLRKEFKLDSEKKIVIYQGYLSINRGIENVLSSWEYVNNNIVLIFMGYGPLLNKIKQIIKNKKLSNRIFIKKAVKPEEIISYTSSADLGVSLIQNTCLSYFYASPNKVWEYILSGIPFLVSDLPEMRKLAIDEGMGLIVDHKSPKDIASKINFILDHPNIELYKQCKENCIKNGKNKYNWDLEKEKFIEIYQKLLNSKNEK